MRFLTGEFDAPDIPERLLQDHEDGKVVFFCGAGISYPAGLPGFGTLVEQVYNNLGIQPRSQIQQVAFKNHQYDVAISLLESNISGGRNRVRKQIAEILSNPTINEKTTVMHKSLLTLSKNRDGKIRLVTTNFDRIFEHVIKEAGVARECFEAPALPIANEEWNGIVYLHGLLCEEPESEASRQIIISSGDFGQAYLIDRWAARFLGQLFKKFSVCFIGYSLEDPVVRYMTDAIAAASLHDENLPEMFAFCAYKGSSKEAILNKWKAKGVTPIAYNQKKKHRLLQETLKSWSSTYQEGGQGKVNVVRLMIGTKPSPSTVEDDPVRKMIWALSDPTGKPAEFFAKATPVFDLAWLSAFSGKKYPSRELAIFGVHKSCNRKFETEYSLLDRPYTDAQKPPAMSLVRNNFYWIENDRVMNQLCNWLVRHLNNPNLIIWVSEGGGILHPEFRRLIIGQLDYIADLKNRGQDKELGKILLNSPDGIPDEAMTTLWELALSGKLCIPVESYSIIQTCHHIKKYGLSSSFKSLLLKALSPTVILKRHTKYGLDSPSASGTRIIGNFIDAEVVVCNQANIFVEMVKDFQEWKRCLPDFVVDFTLLLKEAMDLQKKLGKISNDSDYSCISINSIIEIEDRESRHSWILLARILRDSWLELQKKNNEYADLMINLWWNYPYPIFKRLSFYALSHLDIVDADRVIQMFSDRAGKWLWSFETQFEVLQLLKKIAESCTRCEIERIERLLLDGLPEEFARTDAKLSKKEEYYNRALWLRLGVLKEASSGSIDIVAEKRFEEIIKKYGLPKVVSQEQEYPIRMSMKIESEFECIKLPREAKVLYTSIRDNQERKGWEADDWKDLCKAELDLAVDTLLQLHNDGFESFHWWDSAFCNWASEEVVEASWMSLSKTMLTFSEEFFTSCSQGLSRWIQAIAKRGTCDDDTFLALINRIISCSLSEHRIGNDYVTFAINNPVGISMLALMDWWFNKKPKDGELLPHDIKQPLEKICTQETDKYINGKVILASYALSLFRIDSEWTKSILLPLFDWSVPRESTVACWQGFLWNPRITLPFLDEFKKYILPAVDHRDEFGLGSQNYVRLITNIGIHKPEFFTYKEISTIISQFDTQELIYVSNFIKELVESAGDELEEIWDCRLSKFFQYCWPKKSTLFNEDISQTIALICIRAEVVFEKVYHELQFYISAIEYPDYVLMELEKTVLCEKFPEATLNLIDMVIGSDSKLSISSNLKTCLDKIIIGKHSLESSRKFQRLFSLI
jgi:hypothetical protein